MSPQRADGMKWGVERRLAFVEFRLQWDGHVNRSDLVATFGISPNQATKDLVQYSELAPANIEYDKHQRAYVRGEKFLSKFMTPGSSEYLAQLRSMAEGILSPDETWIGFVPAYDVAPTPFRAVEPSILRAVIGAIYAGQDLEVRYQSLSTANPTWRWIGPHALSFDGFRWHARSFCYRDGTFKDFLLSRVMKTRSERDREVADVNDDSWSEFVDLEVQPHPEMSASQKSVVEKDYGMKDGRSRITVRRALLYYALRRLGLDTDPDARTPREQQIVLADRDAVLALLERRT